MQLLRAILTPLVAAAVLATAAPLVQAQNRGDDTLLEMHQAFRKGDRKKLEQLLPAARGHALEPWAAYWELKLRLGEASPAEIQAFLKRYAGTYQEDRLRNDWLLLLGQRRDWSQFAEQHPSYRMSDDKEVRCYALLIETLKGTAPATAADEVRRNWYAQRDSDDGCTHAAGELYSYKQLTAHDVWRKARLAVEANRVRSARAAVEIVSPESSAQVKELMDSPTKYLQARATARGKVRQELVTLALIKLAQGDADNAATQLDNKWSVHLSPEERNWVWGVIGKQAAQRLSSDAVTYFGNVTKDSDLTDDLLGWKARAALRAGQWKVVRKAYAGHARRVMMGVWSHLRQFMYTKFIVVVDDDVDVRDWKEVIWAITTRMDPARDTMMVEHTPIDYLDFASPVSGLGSKMGMDATNKWPGETQREWGRPMHMTPEASARAEALMRGLGL